MYILRSIIKKGFQMSSNKSGLRSSVFAVIIFSEFEIRSSLITGNAKEMLWILEAVQKICVSL